MDEQMELFSNKALKEMIVPLFLEQLLIMLVGLADTLVVSYAGEAAVSGVSLVNQFNTIFIYLFTALASGGAVVISQYIGRKAMDAAGESASQLLLFSVIFSALVSALVLIGNEGMLRLMFGKVESDVMQACITYLRISAYSYPALAVYNAGAALFRSMGKTSATMYLSVASNIINVIGNLIGVFVLHAGVAGVAWPSLIARTFSAGVITVLCFRRKNDVFYAEKWIFQWNGELMRNILRIAIPNGLENSMFQIGKLMVAGIVSMFGVSIIAANAISNNISSLCNLPGTAVGLAIVTVVGQCVGAGDVRQARYYANKLILLVYGFTIAVDIALFIFARPLAGIFNLSPEALDASEEVLRWYAVAAALFWPASFTVPNALRAAGDARFTMGVSVFCMWVFRIGASYLLVYSFDMGLLGIWVAMFIDWVVRAAFFVTRYLGSKWLTKRVV